MEAPSLLSGAVEPDWEGAWTWEAGETTGTVVPARLAYPVNYVTMVEKRNDTVSLICQPPHVWILFNEDNATGETVCFLASLLPDESYVGDLSSLGPNPQGSDYRGLAIYSDPDGTPLWGQRFENGEITNTLRFDTAYENEADPDVRIRMGIDSGTVTRTWVIITFPNGNIYAYQIDDIIVTAPSEDESYLIPPPGGGSGGEGGSGGSGGNSGGGGGGTPGPSIPQITVSVPNNYCVVGSLAAALQAKLFIADLLAISMVENALRDTGIEPILAVNHPDGIPLTDSQWVSVLRDLGFTVTGGFNPTTDIVQSHFNLRGFGIGILPGTIKHAVFLMGYNSSTNSYTYYDATQPSNNRVGTISNGSIDEFLIK